MKASVIMSTYNAEEWLEKVLWGFSVQTTNDFEIIIADDGSSPKTKALLERMREKITMPIVHVWHEDNGFQKMQILNSAIVKSASEYLIFTDGDCIPRCDFVATHLKMREKGYFLSGGYFKLSLEISKKITAEDILKQSCFDIEWLKANGLRYSFKNFKFTASGFLAMMLNFITTTKPSWNGHNASGWKADMLSINGFNQEMQYGGEDREFGERLSNYGIRPKQIRYSAICVHLEHARGYVNQESINKNNIIRKFNKKNRIVVTDNGISVLKK